MRALRLIAVCGALLGCGPRTELPALAVFDGVCTSSGTRYDANGATPYEATEAAEIAIRNGVLVRGPCSTSIVGFDGTAFDLVAASCNLAPGVLLFAEDGSGTLHDGVLTSETWTTIDYFEEGVTFEFTSRCEATER